MHIHMYVCVYVYLRVCECICVCAPAHSLVFQRGVSVYLPPVCAVLWKMIVYMCAFVVCVCVCVYVFLCMFV